MPTHPDRVLQSPIEGESFDIRAPRSGLLVSLAGVLVVIAALGGFVRGLISVHAPVAGSTAGLTGPVSGAKPAAPMAQNPNWSILNGPQILTPPPPKAQSDDDDDDDDDSDAPDEQPAAAQAAPPAATPAPAAAPAQAPAQAAPAKPPVPTPADVAGVN